MFHPFSINFIKSDKTQDFKLVFFSNIMIIVPLRLIIIENDLSFHGLVIFFFLCQGSRLNFHTSSNGGIPRKLQGQSRQRSFCADIPDYSAGGGCVVGGGDAGFCGSPVRKPVRGYG